MQTTLNNRLKALLSAEDNIEDQLYLQVDQLLALCSAQSILNSREHSVDSATLYHLANIVETRMRELKQMLNRIYE